MILWRFFGGGRWIWMIRLKQQKRNALTIFLILLLFIIITLWFAPSIILGLLSYSSSKYFNFWGKTIQNSLISAHAWNSDLLKSVKIHYKAMALNWWQSDKSVAPQILIQRWRFTYYAGVWISSFNKYALTEASSQVFHYILSIQLFKCVYLTATHDR